jgi:hypothetical protein
MFPNVEKISFDFSGFKCEHSIRGCSQCNDEVIKCLSKLNRLKVLQIIDFSCVKLKSTLKMIYYWNIAPPEELKPKNLYSELILIDLIQSLVQLCDTNTKLLCTLQINKDYFDLITEKKNYKWFRI